MVSVEQQLEQLEENYQRGVVTGEQYHRAKALILGQIAPVGEFGAYFLLERITANSRATSWLARHRTPTKAEEQGGTVILKTLDPRLAGNPEYRDRFRREAELGKRLDHRSIARVLDLVIDAEKLALVMEYIDGVSLAHTIHEVVGPIPWRRALTIACSSAETLAYAHGRDVVHRNIKPANIMLLADDRAVVMDFGIAQDGGNRMTMPGTQLGTLDYGAPEQFTDASTVDARADVYGLGMTLFEMVAGRTPWDERDEATKVIMDKIRGEIPPPTEFFPSIPTPLVDAIMKALSVDPGSRHGSMEEFRTALVALRDVGMRTGPIPMMDPKAGSQTSLVPTSPERAPTRISVPSLDVRFSATCPFCDEHPAHFQLTEPVPGSDGTRLAVPICESCHAQRDGGRSSNVAAHLLVGGMLTAGLALLIVGGSSENLVLLVTGGLSLTAAVVFGVPLAIWAAMGRRSAATISLHLALRPDGAVELTLPTESAAETLLTLNGGRRL